MNGIGLYILIFVFGLVLSFSLSGMESGLLALNPARIRQWMRGGRPGAAALYRFLQQPESLLWTVLVGNTLANFTTVTLLVLGLHRMAAGRPGLALGVFLPAVLLMYAVCDLLPKMLFQRFPNRLTLALIGPFRVVHVCLQPLVWLPAWVSRRILHQRTARPHLGQLLGSREELRLLLRQSVETLTEEERRMAMRVLDLPGISLGRVMTPLDRTTSVTVETTLAEAFELSRRTDFTRFPVWEERGGERRIAGVLSLRRLLYQEGLDRAKSAGTWLLPALYLPAEMGLEPAMRRMQRTGQRLAIVLGGDRREVGVVSLEDIVRFIFGEVNL